MDEFKTVKCPSCGTEHPEGAMFCNECGARLDEESAVPAPEMTPAAQPEESTPEEASAIPEAEAHKESKREIRQREKAEKEAAKLQAKLDKKAVKMAEKAARKAERRKRNIWAIVLMVLFFAGMCYAGWNLLGQYQDNQKLTAQNEDLQIQVEKLESTVDEQKETIAANQESYNSEQESANSKIDELSGKLVGAEEKIEQLQEKLDESEESVKAYKSLTEALNAGSIGYASDKLYADHGIVFMKKSSKGFDVEIFSDGKYSFECVSGESATAEEAEGENGEDYISFTPADYGTSLFKVSGKKDTMYIVVVVE